MNTLLMVAVVLITLAIVVQAGVLVGMYLMSRRVTNNVDSLIMESRKLAAPLESMADNLKAASEDLVEVGKVARLQAHRVEEFIDEARQAVYTRASDVKDHVVESIERTRAIVELPVRQWSALARGIAAGVRTFVARKPAKPEDVEIDLTPGQEYPVA